MQSTKFLSSILLASVVSLCVSCHTAEDKHSSATPPPQAAPPTLTQEPSAVSRPQEPKVRDEKPLPPDTVDTLVARAEAEFQRGQTNYNTGHLEAAKESFDRAFNILLESKLDVHSDDRLEREFDKIVESVNGLEMIALKQGDGFTERRSEPAPIDEANDVTFPVDPAVRAKAEAELRQTRSDLPLVMNDQVASFINYFSSRGRGTLEHALVRSGRYREMISRVLKEEGVPQDLIYLAQAESGFHPLALSRAGARGMWQFMASAGDIYGLHRSWWVDERQDPEKSTRAAARYLKELHNQFGDWYLAMAAYNSGAGTVQRAVQRTGYADFWELYRRNVLPGETRNYVPIIVAVTIMAKNPSQYGLDHLVQDQLLKSDTVRINYPVDLRLVAECVGTSVTTLQDLNPSLLRQTTPKESDFDLRVPVGTAELYQREIASIPADKRVLWRFHRVSSGETLSEIAKRYHVSISALASANNLEPDSELARREKLVIPIEPGKPRAEGAAVSYSKTATRYKVRKGDTVLSVADDFSVPAESVRKWNRIKGNSLTVGKTLLIYRPVAGSDSRRASAQSTKGKKTKAATENKDTKVAAKKTKEVAAKGKRGATAANEKGVSVKKGKIPAKSSKTSKIDTSKSKHSGNSEAKKTSHKQSAHKG